MVWKSYPIGILFLLYLTKAPKLFVFEIEDLEIDLTAKKVK